MMIVLISPMTRYLPTFSSDELMNELSVYTMLSVKNKLQSKQDTREKYDKASGQIENDEN